MRQVCRRPSGRSMASDNASMLFQCQDLYTVQHLLTHKDPRMTQRYAHLRNETLRKASNLAGDIISGALKTRKTKRAKVVRIKEKKPGA